MSNWNQINGRQIRDLVIKNNHVAANAAIAESKLNINWEARYVAALESKKILDYVQLNDVAVTDGGSVNVTFNKTPSTGTGVKGVVNSQPVLIRDRLTGQPIEIGGSEVYGKLTMTPDSFNYTVSFFTGVFGGTETAVNLVGEFPTTTAIDIQYPCRFDLYDINESFAMNEKFVDGAADVTEIENLRQLAKDIYGSGWALNNNANANGIISDGATISIKEHLDRIHGDNTTTGSINKEIKDQVLDPLAAVQVGKGATMVAVFDATTLYSAINVEDALAEVMGKLNTEIRDRGLDVTAEETRATDAENAIKNDVANLVTLSGVAVDSVNLGAFTGSTIGDTATVKSALQELETALNTLQNSGGAEVAATHTRGSNYVNNLFSPIVAGDEYAAIEDRIIDIETVIDSNYTRVTTEIADRIADVDAEQTRAEAAELVIRNHVNAGEASLGLEVDGTKADFETPKYILGTDTFKVAIEKIDEALKVEELARIAGDAGIQTEVDMIETSIGLNADGTKPIYTSTNYIEGTDTFFAVVNKIDTALNAEEVRAIAAEGAIANDVTNLVTLSGVAVDSVNLGVFSGTTIADDLTVKAALQSIELALEEIDVNANDLITLSGVAENAQNLGTFTGATIANSSTIKGALQALETAVEAGTSGLQTEVDAIEASIGLNTNGTKVDFTSVNYVLAGDTFATAVNKIDAALKTEADRAIAKENLIISNLASTTTGKGASLIGIEDEAGKITATTVELALLELYNKTHTLMTDLATASDAAKGANMVGIQALTNRTATPLTVQGGLNILDADLKIVEAWKVANATKIHTHVGEAFTPADASLVITTSGDFNATADFFQVYVNGLRQIPTAHYSIAASGNKVAFTFVEPFITGDNAYVEVIKYNA